jgi:hypothetical protein
MAYNFAMEKADMLKANFEGWKDLTIGADFPEDEQ